MVRKDLGMVTAYAYAVSKGYTGTEAEFAELMASYATVAESAEASAQAAAGSASSAAGSATNASGSASAAAGSASAAASSASTASTKASESASSATAAAGSATTASTKAGEAASSASAAAQSATQAAGSASAAAQSATSANTAKTDAQTAKTAAETAQEKAEEAQAAAEAAAQTLVIDDTLTQANQAAEAKAVGDALKTKAEIDGYYEDMTVGDAEQLVSSQYAEDNAPYKFRTSGGSADIGNRAYVDKIVGGTVTWNQLVRNGNFANGSTNWTVSGATSTAENNVLTIVTDRANPYVAQVVPFVDGHVYLMKIDAKQDEAGQLLLTSQARLTTSSSTVVGQWVTLASVSKASAPASSSYVLFDPHSKAEGNKLYLRNFQVYDLTQMFGSAIADYIAGIESATNGAGVAWFRKLFPNDFYEYNLGELISVSGLQSHDIVGFNQWDEQWEAGSYDMATGQPISQANTIRTKNYIQCIPDVTYFYKNGSNQGSVIFFYDADKNFISYVNKNANTTFTTPANANYIRFRTYGDYGATYKNDICINLAWSGTRNGEYQPHVKHSYPLDSSLTLRGIPKLSADNQLYFDGDEYVPEGKVTRRFGIVDLGTLNWSYDGSFSAVVPLMAKNEYTSPNLKCSKYPTMPLPFSQFTYGIRYTGNASSVSILDPAYTDAAAFKTAMSGVYLVYELATPTEETAEAYQHVQLVDDWGTEEYVSGTICPVGHETRYPANLRDKLQHLPDLASADGYYVVQQTGSQMSLVHFRIPKAPATDGTYTLKATVSGGTPTYTWEEVTE